MTKKRRGTNDEMKTNPPAKIKQADLFFGLGCFFGAIAFLDAAEKTKFVEDWRPYTLYVLLTALGVLLILEATRLTIKSAKTYLAEAKDPNAHWWAETRIVRLLFAIL